MIEIVVPGRPTRSAPLSAFLDEMELARGAVVPTFDPARIDLVAGVSAQILKQRGSQTSPGVTHFAFWTRKNALKALAADATAQLPKACVARPRGLVFHLPPQNVETVFLYSWVISYLAGNANITRLPTSLGSDIEALLKVFQRALADADDQSQAFIRYPVDQDVNRAISAVSDARLVWGGDAKVEAFSTLPLRNGGKPVWFGDRRSLAVVDGGVVACLDDAGRAELASRLHGDIFVFDQMACSSPSRLFVVGDQARHGQAVEALMSDLSRQAHARGSAPATGHVIQKMVTSMGMAVSGRANRVIRHSNALTTVESTQSSDLPLVGGGFLEVVFTPSLSAVGRALEENTQTAVHFGFDADQLQRFAASLPPFRLTRIVPIGQALDFDVVWDGYNLLGELTALLRIR